MRIRHLLPILLLATCTIASAQKKVPFGKLAETVENAAVYSSPSQHSRLFYRLKRFQQLVVRHSDNPDWFMVLLKDRSFGYIPAEKVAVLPYTFYVASRGRSSTLGSRSGNAMANLALNYQGTPYEWGGNDLASGVDCSGFVKKIAGAIGMDLPRTAAEQAYVGTPIYRLEDLRAGDRLYFYEKARGKIGHTGIYLGNGYFIHASHGKGKVATDYLTAGWRKILIAARR